MKRLPQIKLKHQTKQRNRIKKPKKVTRRLMKSHMWSSYKNHRKNLTHKQEIRQLPSTSIPWSLRRFKTTNKINHLVKYQKEMITQLLKMKINLLLFLIKFLQRHLINLNQKLNQSKNSRALLMLKKRNKRKNRRNRTKRSISINNKIWRASWTTRSRKQNPFPMWRKRRPLL